jgi:hypothetical protein
LSFKRVTQLCLLQKFSFEKEKIGRDNNDTNEITFQQALLKLNNRIKQLAMYHCLPIGLINENDSRV